MRIAIITGGTSNEREIAIKGAKNIESWITIAGYNAAIFLFPEEVDRFIAHYKTYDFCIPLFHGEYGEDGQITAFLSTLGCKYSGPDFGLHALCLDKYRTNLVVTQLGICTPETIFLQEHQTLSGAEFLYPQFIKPNKGGSSISNFLVYSRDEMLIAIQSIKNDDILIQSVIGGREFTVGVYRDTIGIHILPIMEIRTTSTFFDFDEKYNTDGSNEIFAELSTSMEQDLGDISCRIFQHLSGKGVVRMDWKYDGKNFFFLEVNTIPGFTEKSFIPKMWKKAGKTEKEFIDMLIGE